MKTKSRGYRSLKKGRTADTSEERLLLRLKEAGPSSPRRLGLLGLMLFLQQVNSARRDSPVILVSTSGRPPSSRRVIRRSRSYRVTPLTALRKTLASNSGSASAAVRPQPKDIHPYW